MSLYSYQPILLSVFPDTELRRATIPIFFDMIQCEYANKGNFTSVSIYYWSRLVFQFPYRITLCWISVLSHVEKNTVNPRAVTLLLAKCEQVQWNPVNTVTNGPKTIGCINEVFFYKKMYGGFCQAGKKVMTRWPYYRAGRKAGFHRIVILLLTEDTSMIGTRLCYS